jgi:hypothetical protein
MGSTTQKIIVTASWFSGQRSIGIRLPLNLVGWLNAFCFQFQVLLSMPIAAVIVSNLPYPGSRQSTPRPRKLAANGNPLESLTIHAGQGPGCCLASWVEFSGFAPDEPIRNSRVAGPLKPRSISKARTIPVAFLGWH